MVRLEMPALARWYFRRQIASGGYYPHSPGDHSFMTISEAASLVLQSLCLPKAGVFLLDMGEPWIKALAAMVRLSGLSLVMRPTRWGHRNRQYRLAPCLSSEELLIEAESQPTAHPLIYRAEERSLPPHELWPQLEVLYAAIAAQDVDSALKCLAELVPEWKSTNFGAF